MAEPKEAQPHTRVTLIICFLSVSVIVQLFFSCSRVYSRLKFKAHVWLDDWITAAGATTAVFCGIIGVVATQYGAGHHINDVNPEWAPKYTKIIYVYQIIFPLACTLPKLGLCVTYLRLFPSQANRIFCNCCIVFVISWCITTIMMCGLQCIPVSSMWNPIVPAQRCLDIRKGLVSTAALNSLSDFLIYLWPTRTLWKIQIPLRRRMGLIFVFCIGSIVCITGIFRMVYLERYYASEDKYYESSNLWIITAVEANLGVICGSLHGIKPLCLALCPRLLHKQSSIRTPESYGKLSANNRSVLSFWSMIAKANNPGDAQVNGGKRNSGDAELGHGNIGNIKVEGATKPEKDMKHVCVDEKESESRKQEQRQAFATLTARARATPERPTRDIPVAEDLEDYW